VTSWEDHRLRPGYDSQQRRLEKWGYQAVKELRDRFNLFNN